MVRPGLFALTFIALGTVTPGFAQSASEPLAGFVIARFERAANARDSTALHAVFAARVVLHQFDNTTVITRGEAVRMYLAMQRQLNTTLHGSEVAVAAGIVVRTEEVRGLPHGRTAKQVAVYRVDDGAIAEIWVRPERPQDAVRRVVF